MTVEAMNPVVEDVEMKEVEVEEKVVAENVEEKAVEEKEEKAGGEEEKAGGDEEGEKSGEGEEKAGEEKAGEENNQEGNVEEDAEPKEKEGDEDFSADKEADLIPAGSLKLNGYDSSFNAFASQDGTAMFSLQGDGFNQLYSGMRANTGVKSGRYYFEAKMLDAPRNVRIGFGGSEDVLPFLDDASSFAFECTGDVLSAGEKKKQVHPRWSRTDVIGALLNVQEKTMSLFINGSRSPQEEVITLPDELFVTEDEKNVLKEALYPTVVSKGSAVECNFSRRVWKTLPFAVRTVGHMKLQDAVVSQKTMENMQASRGEDETGADADKTVDVVVPIGFDCKELIKEYEEANPSTIILTGDMLARWGEKSGVQKRQGQRGGPEKYNLACLDMPMSVFPMLLRSGRKYLMSLANYHNLHPGQRTDMFLKLQHGLNVNVHGIVAVDNICSVVDENKPVIASVRENYELVKMPSKEEGYASITYKKDGEQMEEAELEKLVNEKFTAWKKDCKLKSKVTDLKKSAWFVNNMNKFNKMKMFQQKHTAEAARKKHAVEKAKRDEEKSKKKAKAEEEKAKLEKEKAEKAEKAEGEDAEDAEGKKEAEVEEEEPVVEEEEEISEEIPPIMDEFSDEDWMLAVLRAEMHSILHAFKNDVNDEERISFPAIHFAYYYQLYTGKVMSMTLQAFNCKTLEELTRLVPEICKHTADLDEFSLRKKTDPLVADYDLVIPAMPQDIEVSEFVALTEVARQNRTDRLDAGDENAALNFSHKQAQQVIARHRADASRTKEAQRGEGRQPMPFKRPMPQYNDFAAKRARQNAQPYRR